MYEEVPDQDITLQGDSYFKEKEEQRLKAIKELVLTRIANDLKREAFVNL